MAHLGQRIKHLAQIRADERLRALAAGFQIGQERVDDIHQRIPYLLEKTHAGRAVHQIGHQGADVGVDGAEMEALFVCSRLKLPEGANGNLVTASLEFAAQHEIRAHIAG